MGYEIDNGSISQEDEFIGHGDYQCMMHMVGLEYKLDSLEDIDDVAGDWKKIAEEQQKLMNDIYQELSAAEAEGMGDHSPYFKAKIEKINERIEEVGK